MYRNNGNNIKTKKEGNQAGSLARANSSMVHAKQDSGGK